jgi:hypothetical protein
MNDEPDELHWHALNYRTAATEHAQAMWEKLEDFVERQKRAAQGDGKWLGMWMDQERGPVSLHLIAVSRGERVRSVEDDFQTHLERKRPDER